MRKGDFVWVDDELALIDGVGDGCYDVIYVRGGLTAVVLGMDIRPATDQEAIRAVNDMRRRR